MGKKRQAKELYGGVLLNKEEQTLVFKLIAFILLVVLGFIYDASKIKGVEPLTINTFNKNIREVLKDLPLPDKNNPHLPMPDKVNKEIVDEAIMQIQNMPLTVEKSNGIAVIKVHNPDEPPHPQPTFKGMIIGINPLFESNTNANQFRKACEGANNDPKTILQKIWLQKLSTLPSFTKIDNPSFSVITTIPLDKCQLENGNIIASTYTSGED